MRDIGDGGMNGLAPGYRPETLGCLDGELFCTEGQLYALKACYLWEAPVITAAAFAPNPVSINQKTGLTVFVTEQTVYLDAEVFYSNELYSGEV